MDLYASDRRPIKPHAVHAYVDTISINTIGWPFKSMRQRLKAACGTFNLAKSEDNHFGTRIQVNQPRADAIICLNEVLARQGGFFTQCDIAVDFVVEKREFARRLLEWILCKSILKHRKNEWISILSRGWYLTNGKWGRRGFCAYREDARCIDTKLPTVHLELRHRGSYVVRRLGLHHPIDVFKMDLGQTVFNAFSIA